MSRTLTLTIEAVRLDWRLVAAECRTSRQDLAIAAAVGSILLVMLCQSALSTAALVDGSPPALVTGVFATYLWAACGAAGALTIATGALRTTDRIVSQLRLHPVSRVQSFLVAQVIGLAGRQLIVSTIVSLPFFCLAAGILDIREFLVVAAATVITLRLVPGILRGALAVAHALEPAALALLCLAGVSLVFALSSAIGSGRVAATLPPLVVAGLAVAPDADVDRWFTLLAWTVVVGVFEWLALATPRRSVAATARGLRVTPIPVAVAVLSRVLNLDAALLHGELVRLVRLRRFAPTCAVAACTTCLFVLRQGGEASFAAVSTLGTLLVCPLMFGALTGNLFGPDRAGVQAYWLVLERPYHAVRAKIAAIALFSIGSIPLVLVTILRVAPRPVGLADVYAVVMAIAFFLWNAASGRLASVLFPSPIEPRALDAGSLVRGAAVAAMLVSNGLFALVALGFALLHDSQWIGPGLLLAIGTVVAAVALAAAWLTARVTDRLLMARREVLINALGTSTTVS
jgi:hypothetical protein